MKGLSNAQNLNGLLKQYYNKTLNYNELRITEETQLTTAGAGKYQSQLGVVVSASATTDVHAFGFKSDKGTGDGFMALPLTEESTEFFIAAWK